MVPVEMKIPCAACLAILLSVSSTNAQEMRPISEILEIQPSQSFVRCAALYYSVATWAGTDRLGAETSEQMEYAMQVNLANASIAYQNTGVGSTSEEAIQFALRDMNSATDLYLERFTRNIAATGEAFGQDAMVTSDLNLCQLITERFLPQ